MPQKLRQLINKKDLEGVIKRNVERKHGQGLEWEKGLNTAADLWCKLGNNQRSQPDFLLRI